MTLPASDQGLRGGTNAETNSDKAPFIGTDLEFLYSAI
jgi:hypothetical protein